MVSSRLHNIQALRGLAAASVVVAHLGAIEAATGDALLGARALIGLAGVDIFFVISGFVMVWTAWDRPAAAGSVARFLAARATRIYPLWWLAAGAAALAYWALTGSPVDPDAVGVVAPDDAPAYLARSFALWPQTSLPVLSVGWTLVHEIYFYLGFALVLFAPPRWRLWALCGWAIVVLAAAVRPVAPSTPAPDPIALALHPLTLEFLAGAATALLVRSGRARWGGPALVVGFLGFGVAVLALQINAAERFPEGLTRVVTLGGPSVLLIYGAVAVERSGAWRAPGWMARLGDQSYALYLVHLFIVWGLTKLVWAPIAQAGPLDNLFALPAIFAASLAAGALVHRFVERPLLTLLRRTR